MVYGMAEVTVEIGTVIGGFVSTSVLMLCLSFYGIALCACRHRKEGKTPIPANIKKDKDQVHESYKLPKPILGNKVAKEYYGTRENEQVNNTQYMTQIHTEDLFNERSLTMMPMDPTNRAEGTHYEGTQFTQHANDGNLEVTQMQTQMGMDATQVGTRTMAPTAALDHTQMSMQHTQHGTLRPGQGNDFVTAYGVTSQTMRGQQAYPPPPSGVTSNYIRTRQMQEAQE